MSESSLHTFTATEIVQHIKAGKTTAKKGLKTAWNLSPNAKHLCKLEHT